MPTFIDSCHPSATPAEHDQTGILEHGSDSGEGTGSAGSNLHYRIADAGIVPDSELEVCSQGRPQSRFVDLADNLEEGIVRADFTGIRKGWAVEFDEHGVVR
jgi:hypothetical protein